MSHIFTAIKSNYGPKKLIRFNILHAHTVTYNVK